MAQHNHRMPARILVPRALWQLFLYTLSQVYRYKYTELAKHQRRWDCLQYTLIKSRVDYDIFDHCYTVWLAREH